MKRSTKIFLGLGYVLFFCLSCCISTYFLFPYHRVRDIIVQEVERPKGPAGNRRPSGIHLSIGSLSPTWLPGGVVLEEVHVRQDADSPDDAALEVELDRVVARVGIFGLIFGSQSFSFEAEAGGGSIEGSYARGETETQITGQLDQVSLARLGVLEAAVGLPMSGRISGDIDLLLSDDEAETTGNVSLSIRNLVIGDGEAKLAIPNFGDGLTIPEVEAGNVELELVSGAGGEADIERLEGDGEDVQLRGSGTLTLRRPIEASRIDLLLRIGFSEEFKEQDEVAERLFTVIDMLPQLRPARTSDGALQYRVTGPLGGRIATSPAGSASIDG